MSRRLAIALSLSALLIGGATVYRFAYAEALTVVRAPEVSDTDTTIIDAPIDTAGSGTTTPLTTTDLVGRQVLADYLNLTQNGQATDDNVNALATNYADKLTSLDTFTPLAPADITLSSDSKSDLQAYATTVMALHTKYQSQTASIVKGGGDLSAVDSKGFAPTMNALGKLYGQAATELEAVKVPPSLSVEHLKIINIYLSNAKALSAISDVNVDGASAYAALNVQAQNSSDLIDAVTSIQSKLLASGILFNISL